MRTSLSILLMGIILPMSALGVFENTETGARAAALGGAYTALGDDTWSLLYNPAGLARLHQPEVVSEYGQLYTGLSDGSNISQYFMGASVPLKSYGTAAVGLKQLTYSGLYTEQTISLGYGQWITPHLAGGVAVKYLRDSFVVPNTFVDDNGNILTGTPSLFSQNGNSRANVSADMGLLYRISERQQVGFSVQDINEPNMALAASDTDRVARTWHLGWAGESARKLSLTAELAAQPCLSCATRNYTGTGGIEKWWGSGHSGEFAARGALSIGNRELQQISTGLGYRWKYLNLDYAFVFDLSGVAIGTTSGTHRFSLACRFGAEKRALLNRAKAPSQEEENEMPISILKWSDDSSDNLDLDQTQDNFLGRMGQLKFKTD